VRANQLALGLPKHRAVRTHTSASANTGGSVELYGANFERWAFPAEIVAAESAASQNRLCATVLRVTRMASQPTKDVDKGRVLPFRASAPHSWNARLRLRDQSRSPVSDLSKFSRGPEEDDYPHRIFMNLLAFLVLSFIVGCGILLVDNMYERNKDPDCRLMSRTDCVPIPGSSEIR